MPMPSGRARISSQPGGPGQPVAAPAERRDAGERAPTTPTRKPISRIAWPSATSPPPKLIEATSMPMPRPMAADPGHRRRAGRRCRPGRRRRRGPAQRREPGDEQRRGQDHEDPPGRGDGDEGQAAELLRRPDRRPSRPPGQRPQGTLRRGGRRWTAAGGRAWWSSSELLRGRSRCRYDTVGLRRSQEPGSAITPSGREIFSAPAGPAQQAAARRRSRPRRTRTGRGRATGRPRRPAPRAPGAGDEDRRPPAAEAAGAARAPNGTAPTTSSSRPTAKSRNDPSAGAPVTRAVTRPTAPKAASRPAPARLEPGPTGRCGAARPPSPAERDDQRGGAERSTRHVDDEARQVGRPCRPVAGPAGRVRRRRTRTAACRRRRRALPVRRSAVGSVMTVSSGSACGCREAWSGGAPRVVRPRSDSRRPPTAEDAQVGVRRSGDPRTAPRWLRFGAWTGRGSPGSRTPSSSRPWSSPAQVSVWSAESGRPGRRPARPRPAPRRRHRAAVRPPVSGRCSSCCWCSARRGCSSSWAARPSSRGSPSCSALYAVGAHAERRGRRSPAPP